MTNPRAHVQFSGDPVEDTAAALKLAESMSGRLATEDDMAEALKRAGAEPSAANVRRVRELLTK